MKKVSVNFRLDASLAQDLERFSKATRITKTEILERALSIAMAEALADHKAELDAALAGLNLPPAKGGKRKQ